MTISCQKPVIIYFIINVPKESIPVVTAFITGEIIILVIPVIHNTTNKIENI